MAIAAAAMAALILAPSAEAGAAVFPAGGISYVVNTHTATPGAPTSGGANTLCPSGTRPLSGGLSNNASFDDLWLNAASPAQSSGSSGYTGWGTQWQEVSIASDVAIKTYTICDETKPKYVDATFTVPSDAALGSGKAKCPADRHVYGGGGQVENGNGDVIASYPYDGSDNDDTPDDGWRVEADTIFDDLDTTVWAVCGKRAPKYRSDSAQVPLGQQGHADVSCPTSGKKFLIGGGERSTAADGQARVNASNPFIDLVGEAPSRTWISYLDNRFIGEKTHTAFAICSKALTE